MVRMLPLRCGRLRMCLEHWDSWLPSMSYYRSCVDLRGPNLSTTTDTLAFAQGYHDWFAIGS